jgi:hypothetical protein
LLTACHQSGEQILKLQREVDSLKKAVKNTYKPGFGESMNLIHRHFTEIWQAGKDEN